MAFVSIEPIITGLPSNDIANWGGLKANILKRSNNSIKSSNIDLTKYGNHYTCGQNLYDDEVLVIYIKDPSTSDTYYGAVVDFMSFEKNKTVNLIRDHKSKFNL